MLAFFTYYNPKAEKNANQTQALAYSTNKGRSWTKYAGNPVIKNAGMVDFRDPKVSWDEQSKHWLMALATGPVIRFYSSNNCINWTYMSEFGTNRGNHAGPWECPDFFPVKVSGTNETKWVLLVSVVDLGSGTDRLNTATQYFIGDFNGKEFTSDQTDTLWLDHGKDCYAGNVFNNVNNNERIFIAWMQSHQYGGQVQNIFTKTWAGAATFPRELTVAKNDSKYSLQSQPVKEIAKLYGERVSIKKQIIDTSLLLSKQFEFDKSPVDIKLDFDAKQLPAKYGIRIKNDLNENITLYYDNKLQEFFVDRTNATGIKFNDRYASVQKAAFKNTGQPMTWRLLIDVASLEFFTDDGKIVFTDTFYPSNPFDRIEIFSEGGSVKLTSGTVNQLKAIR